MEGITQVVRHAYGTLDPLFKSSVYCGGGSMLSSLAVLLLIGSSVLLTLLEIVLLLASIALGIAGMNLGRDLANKTGYYLGVIGLTAGAVELYSSVISAKIAYFMGSLGSEMGSSFIRGLFGGH